MEKEPENRIAELMEEKGLRLRDLAVELDVTEHTARRLQKRISAKYIPALVTLFGCTSDHLLGLDREPAQTGKAAA
jgi:plasmid maintenance system antidote protein VapI